MKLCNKREKETSNNFGCGHRGVNKIMKLITKTRCSWKKKYGKTKKKMDGSVKHFEI